MALPILDGNQTAATLSTIITGGAHIPAHTVVSLGSQAISDITSGVSGSVVSISNFPASQATTFGAVTGSVSVLNFPASQSVTFTQASVTFGATTGSVSVLNLPSTQTVAGTVTANVGGIASGVTIPVRLFAEAEGGPSSGQDTLLNCDSNGQLLVNLKSGGASVLGYDGNAFVQVKQVSGSSVTIGSLPAISGTVTANGGDFAGTSGTTPPAKVVPIGYIDTIGTGNLQQVGTDGEEGLPTRIKETYIDGVGYRNLPTWMDGSSFLDVPIAGTVTANTGDVSSLIGGGYANLVDLFGNENIGIKEPSFTTQIAGTVTANVTNSVTVGAIIGPAGGSCLKSISATGDAVRVVLAVRDTNNQTVEIQGSGGGQYNLPIYGTVTIGSLPAISGTVTASSVQGTSVTTSNFTSTTASQTLVSANPARRGLTVFNEGAGNLHICAGATATTIAYQVRLSAGDYWECPLIQTSLTHSAQFASSGTARVVEIL